MSDHLERICIGDRINRDHESEGARIRWTDSGCELVISFGNLQAKEIKGVQDGVFELGLNVLDSIPFVCFRIFELVEVKGFGQPKKAKLLLPWQECPFHLSRFDPETLPHFDEFRAKPEAHLGIAVVLTDWPGMVVKALRFFTVSPFFTQQLIDALLSTAPAYTREGYAQRVQRVFESYPVNAIGEGCRVRCKSGD